MTITPRLKPKSGRRDKKYRDWIHSQPCALSGQWDVVMHHVRTNFLGLGLKPDDRYCIPISIDLHLEGHRIGWTTFERKYNVNLVELAEKCYEAYCVDTNATP